ncbi:hypothetical protein [Dictyobacter arantiisoli]|nr:hypothetical protein [Dictyobacter arantiisoli]
MTSHADYTSEEWNILCTTPLKVGGAVAASAPSGVVGNVKETLAITNSMVNEAHRYTSNQLINEIVPKGINREQVNTLAGMASNLFQQADIARTQALDACRQACQILKMKSTTQEADEYKQWLLMIGKNVASAANEGANLLNVGGINVSPEEVRILDEMASALELPEHLMVGLLTDSSLTNPNPNANPSPGSPGA